MTTSIILTAFLLMVGVALRISIPLFRWLYIPASVIAGFLGLLMVQLSMQLIAPDNLVRQQVVSSTEHWQFWPGVLIAVVFAGMLLERPLAPLRTSLRRAGREGLMVWIIVLGQTAIGLLATWLLIGPIFDMPDAFGMLIETGFAGGHGTAAAMGEVFAVDRVGLDSGRDLGVMMATIGLVYGIISGVFWINIGVRRRWTARGTVDLDFDSRGNLSAIGNAVVRSDLIDPLLIQAIWLAIAFGIGMVLQWSVNSTADWVAQWQLDSSAEATADPIELELGQSLMDQRIGIAGAISSFPLFIYTLFAGLLLRRVMTRLGISGLIDPACINRLCSAAMDILIVAAIASLNLRVVTQHAGAIAILFALAAIWTAVCLVVLSRWILPKEHWFELGLINYGMSTGTTATGFVLLRMIDPELDSGAAEDYAIAAPLSSPFVGGGMLTIGIPLFVLGNLPLAWVSIVLTAVVAALIGIGFWIARPRGKVEDFVEGT